MTEKALQSFLDEALGGSEEITVTPMVGGGSCDVFTVDRGRSHWVLRRAPSHATSATAHNVLREYRILDAIKDQSVPIARPVLSCGDIEVFGGPFYLMDRIEGAPIRTGVPQAWASSPELHGKALEELIDALVAIHAVDWAGCGLGDMAHEGPYLPRQLKRWMRQLDSYGGRDLPAAQHVAEWLENHLPADQASTLYHGDYKLDNVMFALDLPPRLLAVVDWEMAGIGDPLVDLAWALIFHPGPEGTMPLGMGRAPTFALEWVPSRRALIDRYAQRSGRPVGDLGWYDVFARWKLAIALEGGYVKFLHGLSDKPIHEFFGRQADLLLGSATTIIERGDTP